MRLSRTLALLAASAFAASALAPTVAQATTTVRSYPNCTALNKVYRHGVARTGARDKATHPVTTFAVNTKTYRLNDGVADHVRSPHEIDLDRDNDGVACEKA